MKVTLFWLPSPRVKKLFWGGVVGVTLGLILLTIAWVTGLGHEESYTSHENSLPVSSQAVQVKLDAPPLQELQGEDYFVNYRLEREKYRQETKGMLQVLLNSADSKNRAEAQTKWLEISTQIENEGEIENLLKIKGFTDAVVNYSTAGVHVVIYAEKVTSGEIGLIQEIVQRVTRVRLDQIVISKRS